MISPEEQAIRNRWAAENAAWEERGEDEGELRARLEALEAENKRLRDALEGIANLRQSISGTTERNLARAALSPTDGGEG